MATAIHQRFFMQFGFYGCRKEIVRIKKLSSPLRVENGQPTHKDTCVINSRQDIRVKRIMRETGKHRRHMPS